MATVNRSAAGLSANPIPVILDTDIDDSWALALLLKSPELDLKLAMGDYGNAECRARLLAEFLKCRAGLPVVSRHADQPNQGGHVLPVAAMSLIRSEPASNQRTGI